MAVQNCCLLQKEILAERKGLPEQMQGWYNFIRKIPQLRGSAG
jgi:hypothetical protein